MSDRIEQRSLPRRHGSQQPKLLHGILRPLSCVMTEPWALPGETELSRPELGVTGIMTLDVDMRPGASPHIDL
jgi:hypothetical protein